MRDIDLALGDGPSHPLQLLDAIDAVQGTHVFFADVGETEPPSAPRASATLYRM